MLKFFSKSYFSTIVTIFFLLTIVLFVVVLPSFTDHNLMDGTQSGKTWLFLWLVMGISIVWLLKFLFTFPIQFHFCIIDLILFLWVSYVLLNALIHSVPVSNRLIELCGLIVCYVILRYIHTKFYLLIMIIIVIGGIVQAIYGNLQLWGVCPSHHGIFKLTGSFFNPGPYAGYLASVFPIALGMYLFRNPFQQIDKKINLILNNTLNIKNKEFSISKVIAETGIVLILLVILPSQSRAAWIAIVASSLLIFFVRFSIFDYLKRHIPTPIKKTGVFLLICLIISVLLFGLFQFKTDSANGRLFIWKVSLIEIFLKQPLTGVGIDGFQAYYMDGQAEYFKMNIESYEAKVAGDSQYAFNEFIQQTTENGLIGLMFILTILFVILHSRKGDEIVLLRIGQSGIASIVIFAIFSYPAQILPIKICLVFYMAFIAKFTPQKKILFSPKKTFMLKVFLLICVTLVAFTIFRYNNFYYLSYKRWKQAYQLYESGKYNDSLNYYALAYPMLMRNGDYLTNYGKALSISGNYEQAVTILLQSTKSYPNHVAYCALGDSFKALGKPIEAEQAYLYAWHMNPSRFYPKYLLAKLYDDTGQHHKAVQTAQELLKKEIKIESIAIGQIKIEMEKIIKENLSY